MFQDFRVAAPCSADWEKMIGDDRVRYCSDCKLNVYNFSAMTASEVQHLIVSHEGTLVRTLVSSTGRDGTYPGLSDRD